MRKSFFAWLWMTQLLLFGIAACALGAGSSWAAPTIAPKDLETSECGWFMGEWYPFSRWSSRAKSNLQDALGDGKLVKKITELGVVSDLQFLTRDQKMLHGYEIHSPTSSKGYVLFLQGNAMMAQQMLPSLAFLQQLGLDIYVYDFRGYGKSEGNPHLRAIIDDYDGIVELLNKKSYKRSFLYGVSLGAIVLANIIGDGAKFDAAVLDSAPASLDDFGCPANRNPKSNVPKNASNMLMIMGDQDPYFPPSQSLPLAEAIEKSGGRKIEFPNLAHAFMDEDPAGRARRVQAVRDFFAGYLQGDR